MKPTGWVVDMRHYLDEETGDLPDGLPTPVLNLTHVSGIDLRFPEAEPRPDVSGAHGLRAQGQIAPAASLRSGFTF